MNNNEQLHQLKKIEELKKNNKYDNFSLRDLRQLPSFSGLCELYFNNLPFYMINILNDDAVPLKYLWRNYYEDLSAKLWFKMTRLEGYCFDVGAHTGIYSILGNLGKTDNNIISIEPYFLNFSRLLSNLKINNIETKNCLLGAATNTEGVAKFSIKTNLDYHTSGGAVSEDGNFSVTKIKIDKLNLNKKVSGMKIDTEGHEFQVLEGSKNYIARDKPDIIFEINEKSFNKCLELLNSYSYKYYFIDEINKKLTQVKSFNTSLKRPEGSNCLASINNK